MWADAPQQPQAPQQLQLQQQTPQQLQLLLTPQQPQLQQQQQQQQQQLSPGGHPSPQAVPPSPFERLPPAHDQCPRAGTRPLGGAAEAGDDSPTFSFATSPAGTAGGSPYLPRISSGASICFGDPCSAAPAHRQRAAGGGCCYPQQHSPLGASFAAPQHSPLPYSHDAFGSREATDSAFTSRSNTLATCFAGRSDTNATYFPGRSDTNASYPQSTLPPSSPSPELAPHAMPYPQQRQLQPPPAQPQQHSPRHHPCTPPQAPQQLQQYQCQQQQLLQYQQQYQQQQQQQQQQLQQHAVVAQPQGPAAPQQGPNGDRRRRRRPDNRANRGLITPACALPPMRHPQTDAIRASVAVTLICLMAASPSAAADGGGGAPPAAAPCAAEAAAAAGPLSPPDRPEDPGADHELQWDPSSGLISCDEDDVIAYS